ncbi:MAG: WD40 repeat domain-containing protein [Candidatus Hydrothermarchaeaceae archaeon]
MGRATLRIGLLLSLLVMGTVHAVPQLEVDGTVATSGVVKSIDISSDGEYAAAGTEDGYVYFINRSWGVSWRERLHGPILSIAVSSGGEFVVAGDDSNIYLFNKTGGWLWGDEGRMIGDYVRDVDISARGDFVAAGSSNNFLYLFDKYGELWTKKLGSSVWGVGVSPSGEYIAAGTSRGMVYLFRRNGELVWQYNHGRFISDVAIWDQSVVVASRFVHSISAGGVNWSFYPQFEATGVGVSLDGGFIAVSSGGSAHILNDGGKVLFKYSSGDILGGAAVSDGGKVAVGVEGEIRLLALPDTTPPELKITNPVNGSSISGVVPITVSTNEPLKFLQVLIDDNYACGALPCNWDTSASTPGEHTIALIAEDESGNREEDRVKVFIDGNGEFGLVEKTGEILGSVKEELVSEAQTGPLPKVEGLRPIEIETRWIIGAFLFVPAAAYLYHRRNKKGYRYRWKPKRRRWPL